MLGTQYGPVATRFSFYSRDPITFFADSRDPNRVPKTLKKT